MSVSTALLVLLVILHSTLKFFIKVSAERACVLIGERWESFCHTPLMVAYLPWEQKDLVWKFNMPEPCFPPNVICRRIVGRSSRNLWVWKTLLLRVCAPLETGRQTSWPSNNMENSNLQWEQRLKLILCAQISLFILRKLCYMQTNFLVLKTYNRATAQQSSKMWH